MIVICWQDWKFKGERRKRESGNAKLQSFSNCFLLLGSWSQENNVLPSVSHIHVQNIVFAALCQSDMIDLLFPISSTFLCIALIFNMDRDMAEFFTFPVRAVYVLWQFMDVEKGLGPGILWLVWLSFFLFFFFLWYYLIWVRSGGLWPIWSQEVLLINDYCCQYSTTMTGWGFTLSNFRYLTGWKSLLHIKRRDGFLHLELTVI